MRSPGRNALGLVATLALVGNGCSVLVGRQFETPQCSDDSQCDVLNTRDGIGPAACARWQCAPGQAAGTVCTLRRQRDDDDDGDPPIACGGMDCDDTNAGVYANGLGVAAAGDAGVEAGCGARVTPGPAPECYDGRDNNCNAVIDEGANVITPAPLATATVSSDPGTVNYSRGRDGTLGAVYSHANGGIYAADLARFTGASADAVTSIAYQSLPPIAPETSTLGCYVLISGTPALIPCDYADAALDEIPGVPNTWFATTVNTRPCGKGQVRAGYLARDAGGASLVIRGPDSSSHVFLGVDHGGTDPACSSTEADVAGATLLNVASLPDGTTRDPEALAVWVARDFSATTSCLSTASPVRVLGLDYQSGGPTVLATNNGSSQSLGSTTGNSRPAVAPVNADGGYLVGYPARAGANAQIELHFVPRINLASPADTVNVSAPAAMLALDADANDVAFGPGPQVAGLYTVGTAWREGCGAGSSVWFAPVSVGVTTRMVTPGAAIKLSTGGDASEPSLVYLATGLLAQGRTYRNHTSTVDAESTGGWLVVWVRADGSSRRIVGRRVAMLDLTPVDDVEIDLGPASGGDVSTPRVYPAPAGAAHLARLTYRDRASHALVGTEILTPAR